MGLLDGKVALVTGGTRGIGRAIVERFLDEGASVAFTGRGAECPLEAELAERFPAGLPQGRTFPGCPETTGSPSLPGSPEAQGSPETPLPRVKYYPTPDAGFSAIHEVVDAVLRDFGRVDILVNNAGITDDSLMLRMSEEQWDNVIAADLKAAFSYVHALTPSFARQRCGSIINVSSVVGLHGNAGQANYAAAKAGLVGLSKSVAKELGGRGVRCNCIAPGFIGTDMTSGMPEEWRKNVLAGIPMRREGLPEEVAGVALFLASPLASYVNGEVIACDGGMSC